MKQSVLVGRTAGLRPSERRRLEQICHRRHPCDSLADELTLHRLAALCLRLETPLTLAVDGRGVCRFLWVGELDAPTPSEPLAASGRRREGPHRLITCAGTARHPLLHPGEREGLMGLDLKPTSWLRFGPSPGAGGRWPASLSVPASLGASAWSCLREDDLASLCGLDPQAVAPDQDPEDRVGSRETRDEGARDKVFILSLGDGGQDSERRLAELQGLVSSAGGLVLGSVRQRPSRQNGPNLWGDGKLREAALEARRVGANLVVTDRELSPLQARHLERVLDLPVSDRSELILDIFAQRAASAAGRLQVELAQLRYRLPRLTGRGLSLSRQGGGIGTRGPGETQLEKDRRAIARRLERLQRDVQRLGEHRTRLRQQRSERKRLALVGYTNAGKSSLLNALSGAPAGQGVLAADQLFATLDPTTRRLHLGGAGEGAQEILITDTVGFIEDLPPALLEAFRSTVEEALEADGLLIVVDLGDPAWPEQLQAVQAIMNRLGADRPRLVIGNQIDRCPSTELERAQALVPDMLFVSATSSLGLQHLCQRLQAWPPACPALAEAPCQHSDVFSPEAMALQLGDTVPDFTQDSQLGPINLYDFADDHWVVLFSHPADYTPVCTTELGEVARLRPEWEKRNVKTIALSVDSAESHKGWICDINEIQKTSVDYPILADLDKRVSDLYGMIHPNSLNNLTVRSVFIIDPNKKLRLQITYPASTGRNFDEILRVIDSLQLTDNHQVATPVNWKDGQDCVVVPSIPTEEARAKFPKGVTEIRPYLRMTPQPNR